MFKEYFSWKKIIFLYQIYLKLAIMSPILEYIIFSSAQI